MAAAFEQAKDEIARLVAYFRANDVRYLSPAYKETWARQEFIDPFFIALGWDVRNERRVAPQYREVITEESLDVEGHRKAPDYVFRIGQTNKFFAEAKKPGVAIKSDPAPAYQLRRYAWSAKLPLSILTDFHELAVYECRRRPRDSDKASIGRIHYIGCDEYPDRFREVWDLFSRDAVWAGSFDRFVQAERGKRGMTGWFRWSSKCCNCTSLCTTPRPPPPTANFISARLTAPTARLTGWSMNCMV